MHNLVNFTININLNLTQLLYDWQNQHYMSAKLSFEMEKIENLIFTF
jgi:hypothetical protein